MSTLKLNWRTRSLTVLSATVLATLIACGGGAGGATANSEVTDTFLNQISSAAAATTSVFNCL